MRVVVIGAGVAGLASAARMAAAGHSVHVIDANPEVGGKIAESSISGYRFDRGPSLFTLPNELDAVFLAANRQPRAYYDYVRLQTCCNYLFSDGTQLRASADPALFAATMEAALGVPHESVSSYLTHAHRLYDATTPVFLRRSLHRMSTYTSAETGRALLNVPLGSLCRTLHDFNAAWFGDARAVQLFDRYATYNGSNPFRASAVLSQIPHLEHNVGAYFPQGGMSSIPRALARLCEDLGVQFKLGSRVKRIRHAFRQVVGVDTAEDTYEADIVVCAGDVVNAYELIEPHIAPPASTAERELSSSGLIFYWGMKRSFPELDVHNVFFSSDYRREFEEIFEQKTAPTDPTIYVHISSKVQPADAPPGRENWFVMVNVPADYGQPWPQLIGRLRAAILETLSARLGSPIESSIEVESHLEPRLIEQQTSSFKGALYGASSNHARAAFLRHPNFSRQIGGLFFCGGSVHPGGGIPLCLHSAAIVAHEVSRFVEARRGRTAPKELRAPS